MKTFNIILLFVFILFNRCTTVDLSKIDITQTDTYLTCISPEANIEIDSTITDNGNGKIIRTISIEGNDYTNEKVIRRELALIPGKIYERKNALISVKRLYCLRYFWKVSIHIKQNEDNTIDCIIKVDEKERVGVNYCRPNR